MPANADSKVPRHLAHKPTFIKVWGTIFGIGFAGVLLWMFAAAGDFGWWFFLVIVSVPTGWLWAFFMWYFVEPEIRKRSSLSSGVADRGNSSG